MCVGDEDPCWDNRLLVVGAFVIALYLSACYWRGQDSYVLIHDNLDSVISLFKVMGDLGFLAYLDPRTTVPNVMNGLPIFSLSHGLNFGELSYFFLETFSAYILNETISKFVAFVGMFLLLRRHVLPKGAPLVVVGASVCFALLPFLPAGFLCVSGQPLIFYAFLNVLKKQHRMHDWIIIVLFPFYSSLVLSGFAICFVLFGLGVYDLSKNRKFNQRFSVALLLFCCLYLGSHYKLVYGMLFQEEFVSHRSERALLQVPTFADALEKSFVSFRNGQYHAASLQGRYIWFSVVLAGTLLVFRTGKRREFCLLLISCLVISLLYGYWKYLLPHLPDHLLVKGFNWSRLHFLHPTMWYLLLAISLDTILLFFRKKQWQGVVFVAMLLAGQGAYAYQHGDSYLEKKNANPTFRQFYSEKLFQEIKTFVGKDQGSYTVVSVGIHPSVAQYNGFYTLDGYVTNYSLEYKKKFRPVIEGELKKNEVIQKNYDFWGNRCYAFSAEIGYGFINTKARGGVIRQLDFNLDQLRTLGGEYVLSAVPILNYWKIGLDYERNFERADSPWRIWLYRIPSRENS